MEYLDLILTPLNYMLMYYLFVADRVRQIYFLKFQSASQAMEGETYN